GKQSEQDAGQLTDDDEKQRKREERKKRRRFKDNEEGREYECLLCDCKFYTVAQYNVHIQTYEHRKRKVSKNSGGSGMPGDYGSKIVHCRVCNVYTNSAKQLAEHLGGTRHKSLCFKFNVPLTSLEVTSKDTKTLEATKLVGTKLQCKYCQVELNSMNQYEDHMKSKNHKLRAENKPLKPDKKVKKESKKFYRNWTKDDNRKGNSEDAEEKSSSDKAEADAEKAEQQEEEEEEAKEGKEDKEEDPKKAKEGVTAVGGAMLQMRKKYELDKLDDLHTMPCARNERKFSRKIKPPKAGRLKPVPYMCDICQEFMNSAFELNEHLNSDDHKKNMRNFISGKKEAAESACNDDAVMPPLSDGFNMLSSFAFSAELFCDVCQLMLQSASMLKEGSVPSKKAETKQGVLKKVKTYCDVCREEVEPEVMMSEHVKSKKHKFLMELKASEPAGGPKPAVEPGRNLQPVAGPARAPGTKASRWESVEPTPLGDGADWFNAEQQGNKRKSQEEGGGDSRPHKKRHFRSERKEEMPLLAALALERKALQQELAKRKREIEEQKALVEELRRRHEEEEEKMVLKRMIDECRQLLEERQRREAGQRAAIDHGTSTWNHSPLQEAQPRPPPRDFEGSYDGGRSRPFGPAAGGEPRGSELGYSEPEIWDQGDGGARKALLPRPDEWEGSRGSPASQVGSQGRGGDWAEWEQGRPASGRVDAPVRERPRRVRFGDEVVSFRDDYDDRATAEDGCFGNGGRVRSEGPPVRESYFGNSDESTAARGGYFEEEERFQTDRRRGGGYLLPQREIPLRGIPGTSGGDRMCISTVPLRFGSCHPPSHLEQFPETPLKRRPEQRVLTKDPIFPRESQFSDVRPLSPAHYRNPSASSGEQLSWHADEQLADASHYSSWSNETSIPLLDTPVALPEKVSPRDVNSGSDVQRAPADWQGSRAAPMWEHSESPTRYSDKPYGTDLHEGGSWRGGWEPTEPQGAFSGVSRGLNGAGTNPEGAPLGGKKPLWGERSHAVPETQSPWGADPPRIPGLDFV
ncbi:unnamed protein product, partial [Ixodes hexagonus]